MVSVIASVYGSEVYYLVARRKERNCAGSRKRIFKDKKYLKDFQLID